MCDQPEIVLLEDNSKQLNSEKKSNSSVLNIIVSENRINKTL